MSTVPQAVPGRRARQPGSGWRGRTFAGAVWVGTGVAWLATWGAYELGPSYSAPARPLDYLAIALFSAALLLTATSLCAVARAAAVGRTARILGGVASFGSALAGVADVLEDGFGLSWFAYPFFAGMLLLGAASVGFAVALVATRPGFRLAAVATLFAVAPFATGDTGPGKLVDGALWLALGLRTLHRRDGVS